MVEFILFCVPTVIYVAVGSRRKGPGFLPMLRRAGVAWGKPAHYGWALLMMVPLLVVAWLTTQLIPTDAVQTQGVVVGQLTSVGAVLGIIARATGEEIFFRGFLGGLLMRRLGFWWGNLVQSLVFLVPHLALLLIDTRMWPILPLQFAIGWLLGWLRHRADSFVPGAVIHSLTNLLAGLLLA